MSPSPLDNIRIVLVNTSHAGNIGGVARAMKNMGLSDLCLVAPRAFPAEEATWRAAGAADLLDAAVVVADFDAAVADCALVIGSSARQRRIPWPLLEARPCCEQAYREAGARRVAVVFGREDRGLTNDELQKCHLHVNIPADDAYSALNLAMAVQVIGYELRMAHLGARETDPMAGWDVPAADAGELERLYDHFATALAELGFLQTEAPKQMMTRLRRLFQRARPDQMEVNILRGILSSAQQAVRRANAVEGTSAASGLSPPTQPSNSRPPNT